MAKDTTFTSLVVTGETNLAELKVANASVTGDKPVMANIEELDGAADNATIVAAFNDLLGKLIAAGYMEEPEED